MSLDDLIARLEKDADARVADVEGRARAEVEAIEAASAAASSAAVGRVLAERRAARRAALDKELAAARQDAMRRRLEARHALVSRVLARARALVEDAGTVAELRAIAARRLAEALRFVGGRASVVRCRPALAAALGAPAGVAVEARDDGPVGLVLATRDGALLVDDTLLSRLDRLRAVIAMEAVREVDR